MPRKTDIIEYKRGSDNVFEDLGFENAGELEVEATLLYAIYEAIKRRKLTQTAAAELLGLSQPDVSKLMNLRYAGFSIRRLAEILTKLGQDVELVVRPAPARRQGTFVARRERRRRKAA